MSVADMDLDSPGPSHIRPSKGRLQAWSRHGASDLRPAGLRDLLRSVPARTSARNAVRPARRPFRDAFAIDDPAKGRQGISPPLPRPPHGHAAASGITCVRWTKGLHGVPFARAGVRFDRCRISLPAGPASSACQATAGSLSLSACIPDGVRVRLASRQVASVIRRSSLRGSGAMAFARPWLPGFAWARRDLSAPARASLRSWSHFAFRGAVQCRSPSGVRVSVRAVLTSGDCEPVACHPDLSRARNVSNVHVADPNRRLARKTRGRWALDPSPSIVDRVSA